MKKLLKIFLTMSVLMLIFTIDSFACEAKNITIPASGLTLTGKIGDCIRYGFTIDKGQKVTIVLTSSDSKARFVIEDGDEDDTGTTGWSNLTSFSKILDSTDWQVGVTGSSGAAFTLKITITN